MQLTTPSEPTPFEPWDDPDDLPLAGADHDAIRQALQSTQVAIARWTGGIHRPQMLQVGSLHVSPQARWYARTCDGLQEWMARGGFAQDASMDAAQEHDADSRPVIDIGNVDACID